MNGLFSGYEAKVAAYALVMAGLIATMAPQRFVGLALRLFAVRDLFSFPSSGSSGSLPRCSGPCSR